MTLPARRTVILLIVAAVAGGCAGRAARTSPYRAFLKDAPGQEWVRTELFFGLSRASGPAVTEKEWSEFMDGTVTPLFPDGLTVLDGRGQWRPAGGTAVSEPSKVVLILHPPDPALHVKLEQVRKAWKERFGQESVLRATSPAKAAF